MAAPNGSTPLICRNSPVSGYIELQAPKLVTSEMAVFAHSNASRWALARRALGFAVCLLVLVPFLGARPTQGQPAGAEPPVRVPGFWDPRRRPEKPDLSRISVIRFLTEVDYPPFNYAGADGNPQGFNIDLARLLCEELKVGCTVQQRRYETLLRSLNENRGDAVIASLTATPETRA